MEEFPSFRIAIRCFGKGDNFSKELTFSGGESPVVNTAYKEGISPPSDSPRATDLTWEPELSCGEAISLCSHIESSNISLNTSEVRYLGLYGRELEFSKGILNIKAQWESGYDEVSTLDALWTHINEAIKI